MHVKIVSYTSGRPQVMGTVSVDADGQMVTTGELPDGIRDVITDAYTRAKSPQAFLRALPNEFRGAYIRAVRVRED